MKWSPLCFISPPRLRWDYMTIYLMKNTLAEKAIYDGAPHASYKASLMDKKNRSRRQSLVMLTGHLKHLTRFDSPTLIS